MKSRFIKITLLLVGMVMVLSGCSGNQLQKEVPSEPQPIKQTVLFHHYFSGSLSGGIDQMVQGLNQQLTSYAVKAVPIDHESFKVTVAEALKGNSAADLYSYWAGAKTQALSAEIASLDDIWSEKNLDQVYPKSIVESACVYDGEKKLIPITQHFVGIVYNKKIFTDLHLEVPKTWDQFILACESIKKAGITPLALGSKSKWPAQFWFDYLLLRTAPYDYRTTLMIGTANYTDPEVTLAFTTWKTLFDNDYFNSNANSIEWDTGASDMVYKGEAAMTLMGTWIIGYYNDVDHQWVMGEDYDFFEFPTIDPNVPGCSLGPIDGIFVSKDSIHSKEAMETIATFTNTENQKMMSLGSGSFAPSQLVEDSFYTTPQLNLLKAIRKNPYWAFNYDLATPPEVAEVGLTALTDFVEFPNKYKEIQLHLQKDSQDIFKKLK